MNKKKKDLERYIIEHFISNEEIALDVYSFEDNETPDFIITTSTKRISIELTQLMAQELKQVEQYCEKISTGAEKLFSVKYKEKINALITFNKHYKFLFKPSETSQLQLELFKIIEKLYFPIREFKFNLSSKDGLFISDWIESIYITNKLDFHHWQPFGAYLVKYVNFSSVKEIISKKEKKIPNYTINELDEKWLVIASSFGTESSGFRFDHVEEIHSKFDKIFIYQIRENKIIILK